MNKKLVTPLGEIHVCVDGITSEYEVTPHCSNVRSVREKKLTGCYRITVSGKNGKTVRCVVALDDIGVSNDGSSGECYLCSEFVKDNVILTIGAEDENLMFDTNRLRYGMEYVLKSPVDKVTFGVAWVTDYEGQFDIRTYLAADLF